MPCKISIKKYITEDVEKKTESGLSMSVKNANKLADEINKSFGIKVVSFNLQGDYVSRDIAIPNSLIDEYFENEREMEKEIEEDERLKDEEDARQAQMKDAKRAGVDYIDRYMFQKETVPASKASPETLSKVREVIKKMGVNLQNLAEYLKGNPNVEAKNAQGLADLIHGIIAIAEGKEDVATTEEMVHVATAILEQKNPNLITEMINKIDRFAIYDQVRNTYKTDKNYQTKDGKPDIRKIKKEAVDKLITELIIKGNEGDTEFPDLLDETKKSIIRTWWNKILDWFRGQYKKANIDIFEKAAGKIIDEDLGTYDEAKGEGIYLQKFTDAQKKLQSRIIETQSNLKKVEEKGKVDPLFQDTEEANNWYELKNADGTWTRVKKRVTDKVKAFYIKKFGRDKQFTPEEKARNEFKREFGIKGHVFFNEIHQRFFNTDITDVETYGTKKENIGPRPEFENPLDKEMYIKLETYYIGLIDKYTKNGKSSMMFSEVMIYDPIEKEAGTLDLLIVDEEGTGHIIDWKFLEVGKNQPDIQQYKQGAFNIQLGRYKDILLQRYGLKKIGANMAIPILLDVRNKNTNGKDIPLTIKGIVIGSVDPKQITDLHLVPVAEKSASTSELFDNPEDATAVDELIKDLNNTVEKIESIKPTKESDREFKKERLNLLSRTIRIIQSTGNLEPLANTIREMRMEGQRILNDWESIYKNKSPRDENIQDKDLSDFANRLRMYQSMSNTFGKMDIDIGDVIYTDEMERGAKTTVEKDAMEYRKGIREEIAKEANLIQRSNKAVWKVSGQFADKFEGQRNLISGLTTPEKIIKGLIGTFRDVGELGMASTRVLFTMVNNAKGRGMTDAVKEVDELMVIRKKLAARGGDLRKEVQKIYQRDDKNKLVNKLIYRYQKDFFTQMDQNAEEGKRSKSWLKENIDMDAYWKEVKPIMEERIENIKKNFEYDKGLMDHLILETQQKYDITKKDFNGFNNKVLRRHPLEKWEAQEYIDIKNDKDLFDLYTWITKINEKADECGYLSNMIHSIFLPFVRRGMAESLAWDFSLSAVKNLSLGLTVRASDVGYGSINETTKEIENSIPKYFTNDFSLQENGEHDYSDVSEDLFKDLIMYVNHMNQYKYLSEIEGQLQHVKTIEEFKGHLRTGKHGDVIFKDNSPEIVAEENKENLKTYEDFLRALLYEQKYPLSDADSAIPVGKVINFMKKAVNNVAGKEIFTPSENPSMTTMIKVMEAANHAMALKTLGFEFIPGSVNAFGAYIQMLTQAGNYFKGKEAIKNGLKIIGKVEWDKDDREAFNQLVDIFRPLKDTPTYEKQKEAGMSALTRRSFTDDLMMFMRQPEIGIEKAIFLTLLQNSMVVDGKIVNIREYVKSQHPERNKSAATYKQEKKIIEDEITTLKKTKSMDATKKLVDDKVEIPGLDLNNTRELQRLTDLSRRISRMATSSNSDSAKNKMSMSIWSDSMMLFKHWIPKLVETRFGEFRDVNDQFSLGLNDDGTISGQKYDIGRVRLMFYLLGTSITEKTNIIGNILRMNEKGIASFDKIYEDMAQKYEQATGKKFNMNKDEFIDMVRTNLINQVNELIMLFTLLSAAFSMGFIVPDDDKDRSTKNLFRYSQKVINNFTNELSFYYNLGNFQSLLTGTVFPSIGLVGDAERFINHLTMEITGYDVSNPALTIEEVRKKAQPIKNLARILPITKSMMTYGAILSSNFAKEFDITVPKELRR